MSRYSIEGSTLTALGDAIREKTGKLNREEFPPGAVEPVFVNINIMDIDKSQLTLNSSGYYEYTQDIYIPNAKKIKVKGTLIEEGNTGDTYSSWSANYYDENGIIQQGVAVWYDTNPKEKTILAPMGKVQLKGNISKNRYDKQFYDSVQFEFYGLDADNNLLTPPPIVVKNTMTPLQMVDEIEAIELGDRLPEEAFSIKGNCGYKFAYGGWDWFIKNYGDKIITSNITDANNMFNSCQLEQIPITINLTSSNVSTVSMFSFATKLVQLPVINNLRPNDKLCQSCSALKSVNGNQFTHYTTTIPCDSMFSGCLNLRSVDKLFDNLPDAYAGNSIYGMYGMFYSCYSLDELTNLPYIYSTYTSSNYTFGNFVDNCYRLKELTFRAPIITSGPRAGAVLKLDSYTGWSQKTDLSAYGFSNDKRVTDDASYQALKNDPDWWTSNLAYSRYNHDSAVNTINSLPDLSSLSYTNTIRFKGTAGELTDGGAINTLTEEEIAVAAAKGWTVSLV